MLWLLPFCPRVKRAGPKNFLLYFFRHLLIRPCYEAGIAKEVIPMPIAMKKKTEQPKPTTNGTSPSKAVRKKKLSEMTTEELTLLAWKTAYETHKAGKGYLD